MLFGASISLNEASAKEDGLNIYKNMLGFEIIRLRYPNRASETFAKGSSHTFIKFGTKPFNKAFGTYQKVFK